MHMKIIMKIAGLITALGALNGSIVVFRPGIMLPMWAHYVILAAVAVKLFGLICCVAGKCGAGCCRQCSCGGNSHCKEEEQRGGKSGYQKGCCSSCGRMPCVCK